VLRKTVSQAIIPKAPTVRYRLCMAGAGSWEVRIAMTALVMPMQTGDVLERLLLPQTGEPNS
jgi:hypothetical protein